MTKVVFMGTPEFAVPSLNALLENDIDMALVVTQPDRPKGRGHKLAASPVKQFALEHNLDVSQPESLKSNEDFTHRLKESNPDLIVVAAYGNILPKEVLDIPRYGCVNVHASLLPKYRGAAPVHRAIEAGEEVSGVTLMLMDEGLDDGDMIAKCEVDIRGLTSGEALESLADAGAKLLASQLNNILSGNVEASSQDDNLATYAHMVSSADGLIDFSADAATIERKIYAMTPLPGAYTYLHGEKMKIIKTSVLGVSTDLKPGTVVSADKNGIAVQTGDRIILIERLQLAGKKAMDSDAFLRGNSVSKGEILGHQ